MLRRGPLAGWREGRDLRLFGELGQRVPETPALAVTIGGGEGQEGHGLLHGGAVVLEHTTWNKTKQNGFVWI